ncbi:MAG: outer membrane beta-barrel protein [Rickettsiales bacterium]|jgi:opacity protein-like surface antigen|nr:outer membrane beta-barrel protein [Rickettsiales bacterium]
MKKILLASTIALCAAAANAAAPEYYASGKIGFAQSNVEVPGLKVSDMHGFTAGLAFGAGFKAHDFVKLRGELEYAFNETKKTQTVGPAVDWEGVSYELVGNESGADNFKTLWMKFEGLTPSEQNGLLSITNQTGFDWLPAATKSELAAIGIDDYADLAVAQGYITAMDAAALDNNTMPGYKNKSKIELHTTMANLYADFGDDGWVVKPYIGFGLGYASGDDGSDSLDGGFAAAVMAGASYDVMPELALDFGVKYLNASMKSQGDDFDYESVTTTLGARYKF